MKVYEIKHFPRKSVDLDKMLKDGKLSFNNASQRSLVWKNTEKDNRKSLLIDTMMRGLPVPAMYCNCLYDPAAPKTKIYDFMDGKQRTNAVVDYINNKFALVNVPLFNMDDDAADDEGSDNIMNLNGKFFSELPEEFQFAIKTYSFNVYYYENLNQDEVDEIIHRLNNGKPMSAIELTRIKAKSNDIIKEVGNHALLKEILKQEAFDRYTNEDIVIKSWIMQNAEEPSLETKDVRSIMESAEISEKEKEDLVASFDRLYEVYKIILVEDEKIAKRIITKTHLVTLMPIINRAIKEQTVEDFAEWLKCFFDGKRGASISKEYNESASRGSARKDAIKKRLAAMEYSYKTFTPKVKEELDESLES